MPVETFLGGLVVIGPYDQDPVGAHFFCQLVHLQYIRRIVGAGTYDYRPSAVDFGDDFRKEFFFFCIGHGGGFAAGPADQDGVGAVIQQPGGEFCRPVRIQGPVFMEEGHHGCNESTEIRFLIHANHLFKIGKQRAGH